MLLKKKLFSLGFIFLFLIPSCKNGKKIGEKKKNLKKEQRIPEISKITKKIDRMGLDEAKDAYKYYKLHGRKYLLAQTIERIISLTTDHKIINPLLIELADLKFELEKFPEAELLYSKYAEFYPGEKSSKHARFMEIVSSQKRENDPRQDQAKTEKTVRLIKNFLENFEADGTYKKQIEKILNECYTKIIESELYKIEFYLHKYKYSGKASSLKAAEERLIYLRDNMFNQIPTYKKRFEEIKSKIKEDLTKSEIESLIRQIRKTIEPKSEKKKKPGNERNIRDRF